MKDCLIQIPLNAPLDYHMSGKFEHLQMIGCMKILT